MRIVVVFVACLFASVFMSTTAADPIVGSREWEHERDLMWSYGPPIFGNLPNRLGQVILEVATRGDYYGVYPGQAAITIATPEYAEGPAPMSDVFFTVSLFGALWDHPDWSLTVTYSGGETLDVALYGSDVSGGDLFIQAVAVRTGDPSSDIEDPPASDGASMLMSTPNPFQFTTRVECQMDETSAAAPVSLQVLDSAGRVVRTLLRKPVSRGLLSLTWDGRNEDDLPVPNGVYFLQLRGGRINERRQVTIVR